MTKRPANAQDQLRAFIAKFEPKHQRLIRSIRKILRERFPSAHELVYDNYNFFVIGYCPSERPSDCIFSVAADANGAGLCFTHGARLPDPKKLLHGAGNQTRFLRLPSATVLDQPDVKTLFDLAIAGSKVPMPTSGRGKLIIRSISPKQRPRRKEA